MVRAARFDVSTKLLEQALNLPPGARIVGAHMNEFSDRVVSLVVDDAALPEADEPHECTPLVSHVEWNWNLD